MDERHIHETLGNLRNWCLEVLDDGPQWSHREALRLIGRCDKFSRKLEEDLLWWSEHKDGGRSTWPEICEDMMKFLFKGHETFGFGGGPLGSDVVCFCLKLGRRAPEGWHSRLMRRDRSYREMIGDRRRK
jgi:hypothetical protein